jgi:hypothetical protein
MINSRGRSLITPRWDSVGPPLTPSRALDTRQRRGEDLIAAGLLLLAGHVDLDKLTLRPATSWASSSTTAGWRLDRAAVPHQF